MEKSAAAAERKSSLSHKELQLQKLHVNEQLKRERDHWGCVLERQREKHREKVQDLRDENTVLWGVNQGLHHSLRDEQMKVVHTSGNS